jgi:ATP phosphoribosyltransferase regulatory subunit
MGAAVDNLRAICNALDAHGVLGNVSLDLTEIHNLGYYTGITFEVLAHGVGYRLASGGRYDNLVGSFGAPQGAVGAAFGLERLLLALEGDPVRTPTPIAPDVLVGGGDRADCIELINRARSLGLHIVVDLQGRHGDDLWRLADEQGIGCAVDYGDSSITLWMAGGAGSAGECSRDLLWQALQRLAMAKNAAQNGLMPGDLVSGMEVGA